MKSILTIAILLVTVSCGMAQKKIKASKLVGCWTHSFEEKSDEGVLIFRHCDYKEFPAARFRNEFKLKKKGACEWLYLSPTDAHSMKPGVWTYNKDKKRIDIIGNDATNTFHYDILEYQKGILKLRKTEITSKPKATRAE